MKNRYNAVLTIAGSDSGGCAGIQADIKTISACGAYAASVITATTAQNTMGVFDIHPIPIDHVNNQLDAVFSDINFKAIKVGMLHSSEIIELVMDKLKYYKAKNIVIDPVMVATSGDKLIGDDAVESLKTFLPMADVITPNIPEAEILLSYSVDEKNMLNAAKDLACLYNTSVLLKGGHLKSKSKKMIDILYLNKEEKSIEIINKKVDSNNTHGTGCSLSSSLSTYLSKDQGIELAVRNACYFVNKAIAQGADIQLGEGKGPINHFNLK